MLSLVDSNMHNAIFVHVFDSPLKATDACVLNKKPWHCEIFGFMHSAPEFQNRFSEDQGEGEAPQNKTCIYLLWCMVSVEHPRGEGSVTDQGPMTKLSRDHQLWNTGYWNSEILPKIWTQDKKKSIPKMHFGMKCYPPAMSKGTLKTAM